MVAGVISLEIESPVEAKRLWNAMVKDVKNILPKHAPEVCSGVTILEGDGGVGTIRQISFTPAMEGTNYLKERVDEVDEVNFVCVFSQVEGGELGNKVSSSKFRVQFTPKAGGGSVFNWTCEYNSLEGVPVDEAKSEEFKQNNIALFKKIEAYLLSNPSLYC